MPEPPVVELTRDLVAIDSQNPGTGEKQIADFVADYARRRGLEAQIIETRPGRSNVLVSAEAGRGGQHLALSGHLDTKPIGEALSEWRSDPLSLTIDGDLAYGLGSSDMKGAVAAMLLAAERWTASASRGRLSLIFTADEEAGSEYGAKALSERGLIDADAIVIGEPSGLSKPWEALFVVSRGICCFEVVIEGSQGHSGLSDRLKTSATVAAAQAVLALANFEPTVKKPSPVPCLPTVNSGVRVDGGVFYGVHPGHASVKCDVRLVPGMTHNDLDQELRVCLSDTLPSDIRWTIQYAEGSLGWMPAAELPTSDPVVAAAQEASVAVLGRTLPLGAYPGGTDATHFMQQAGVPSVAALGPGWLSVAHGPNECVGVDQLRDGQALYEQLAHAYCGGRLS